MSPLAINQVALSIDPPLVFIGNNLQTLGAVQNNQMYFLAFQKEGSSSFNLFGSHCTASADGSTYSCSFFYTPNNLTVPINPGTYQILLCHNDDVANIKDWTDPRNTCVTLGQTLTVKPIHPTFTNVFPTEVSIASTGKANTIIGHENGILTIAGDSLRGVTSIGIGLTPNAECGYGYCSASADGKNLSCSLPNLVKSNCKPMEATLWFSSILNGCCTNSNTTVSIVP